MRVSDHCHRHALHPSSGSAPFKHIGCIPFQEEERTVDPAFMKIGRLAFNKLLLPPFSVTRHFVFTVVTCCCNNITTKRGPPATVRGHGEYELISRLRLGVAVGGSSPRRRRSSNYLCNPTGYPVAKVVLASESELLSVVSRFSLVIFPLAYLFSVKIWFGF